MILVGTTCAAWKCGETELAWLETAEELSGKSPEEVRLFAALEVDARKLDPYHRLLERFGDLKNGFGIEHDWWTFSIDDHATEIDSNNRLARICMGRNLIIEQANRLDCDWILFLDTDTWIPGDSIPKLLELDWPIVGGHVPNYGLTGPEVTYRPIRPRGFEKEVLAYNFPVQKHWNTAGFLLVHRDIFSKIRWRFDLRHGMTDDPCFAEDAKRLGFPTLVRHDVIGKHVEWLIPVEERTADKKVYR